MRVLLGLAYFCAFIAVCVLLAGVGVAALSALIGVGGILLVGAVIVAVFHDVKTSWQYKRRK